eukprot:TRINITY_DN9893_c0_g1_i2.p1 TRINITY_DN9893_c0_g1~~TRINITY_DN9893_c0_g1_i2.p1  ORF type:complete len:373 (-),score=92.17 TRINITY_DN9893_c0_g1_i2:11-1129(-)
MTDLGIPHPISSQALEISKQEVESQKKSADFCDSSEPSAMNIRILEEDKECQKLPIARPNSEQNLVAAVLEERKKEGGKYTHLQSTFAKGNQRASSPLPSSTNPQKPVHKKNTKDNFNLIKLLGTGAYSKVALVEEIDTTKQFAMKVMEKSFLRREMKEAQAIKEREIWSTLSHPGIIKLFSSFTDEQRLYFIMEYSPSGTLRDYLDRQPLLPYKIVQQYLAELVNVLEYMHGKKIAHRDLKPENCLLDTKMHIKVSDFGASKLCLPTTNANKQAQISTSIQVKKTKMRRGTLVGTKDYVAPEVLLTQESDMAADLWSLGCMAYEMFAGKTPFKSNNPQQTYDMILCGDITCLLYTSPSPRDQRGSRMPSSA